MIEKAEELPADVTRVAAAAELGAYERTWLPTFVWKMLLGVFMAFLAAGLTYTFITSSATIWPYVTTENVGELVTISLMAAIAWLLVDPRERQRRVFGFAGGLVIRDRRGRVDAVGWDTIAHVRRGHRGGRTVASRRTLTIQLHDGGNVEVNDHVFSGQSLNEISRVIDRELTARRVPEAEARIAGGGRVELGDIVLDATGITSPKLSVPWSQVQRADDGWNVVLIRTADGSRRLNPWYRDTPPDVFLLLALVRRLAPTAAGR